jgi:hypothetical protein
MIDQMINRTEKTLKARAGDLADQLLEIAEKGTDAADYSSAGVVGKQGAEIDRLCGELSVLRRLKASRDVPGPRTGETAKTNGHNPWSMIVEFWPQVSDDLHRWASHRSYSEIMHATELITSAIEIRDLGMIREAAQLIIDDLKGRTAKRHVRRYLGKAQHLRRLVDRAIETASGAAAE